MRQEVMGKETALGGGREKKGSKYRRLGQWRVETREQRGDDSSEMLQEAEADNFIGSF